MESQCKEILKDLKKGKHITALTALVDYGCMRLAARIYDLRQEGNNIKDYPVETHSGKVVSCYFMGSK